MVTLRKMHFQIFIRLNKNRNNFQPKTPSAAETRRDVAEAPQTRYDVTNEGRRHAVDIRGLEGGPELRQLARRRPQGHGLQDGAVTS